MVKSKKVKSTHKQKHLKKDAQKLLRKKYANFKKSMSKGGISKSSVHKGSANKGVKKTAKVPSTIYIPKNFKLTKSKIPGAGLGIYSRKDLPAHHRLGTYKGKFITPDEFKAINKDMLYLWQLNDYPTNPRRPAGQTYDAERVIGYLDGGVKRNANFLRYINCPRNQREENTYAKQEDDQINYYTKRPVQHGEELMVWYGPAYGQLLTGLKSLE